MNKGGAGGGGEEWGERGWGGGRTMGGGGGGGRGRRRKRAGYTGENSRLNSKTLFYKECSLGSDKNLSNNLSLLSY